MHIEAEMQKT